MRGDRVDYGVPDLDECVRFYEDLGLCPVHDEDGAGRPGARLTTQAGQVIELRAVGDPSLPASLQDGPSLREIVWGADTREALDTLAAGLLTDRRVWTDAEGTVHAVDQTG